MHVVHPDPILVFFYDFGVIANFWKFLSIGFLEILALLVVLNESIVYFVQCRSTSFLDIFFEDLKMNRLILSSEKYVRIAEILLY